MKIIFKVPIILCDMESVICFCMLLGASMAFKYLRMPMNVYECMFQMPKNICNIALFTLNLNLALIISNIFCLRYGNNLSVQIYYIKIELNKLLYEQLIRVK